MAIPLVALQGQQPDVMGAFQRGQQQAASLDKMKRDEFERAVQVIGSASMYALNGNPNGQADPQKYAEVMKGLREMGMEIPDQIASNPGFANIAASASLNAMQQMQLARSDRDYQFAMQKFERDMMESDRSYDQAAQKLALDSAKQSRGDVPSGYRPSQSGGLEPIPGGPADPANPMNTKRTSGPNLSATVQKEIFEADEAAQAGEAVLSALDRALVLNDQAYSGPMAEQRGYAGSLVGMEGGTATEELKNLVTSQALDQLKATFGAMPTEGERKILLEIQGSVNQAPEVRKRIYERAKDAAAKRLSFSRQKAQQLRSGEYFTEGPAAAQPQFTPPQQQGEVTSQEQYDALPSGAEFMSGGKRYRKP